MPTAAVAAAPRPLLPPRPCRPPPPAPPSSRPVRPRAGRCPSVPPRPAVPVVPPRPAVPVVPPRPARAGRPADAGGAGRSAAPGGARRPAAPGVASAAPCRAGRSAAARRSGRGAPDAAANPARRAAGSTFARHLRRRCRPSRRRCRPCRQSSRRRRRPAGQARCGHTPRRAKKPQSNTRRVGGSASQFENHRPNPRPNLSRRSAEPRLRGNAPRRPTASRRAGSAASVQPSVSDTAARRCGSSRCAAASGAGVEDVAFDQIRAAATGGGVHDVGGHDEVGLADTRRRRPGRRNEVQLIGARVHRQAEGPRVGGRGRERGRPGGGADLRQRGLRLAVTVTPPSGAPFTEDTVPDSTGRSANGDRRRVSAAQDRLLRNAGGRVARSGGGTTVTSYRRGVRFTPGIRDTFALPFAPVVGALPETRDARRRRSSRCRDRGP